jgi:hypothetical protein
MARKGWRQVEQEVPGAAAGNMTAMDFASQLLAFQTTPRASCFAQGGHCKKPVKCVQRKIGNRAIQQARHDDDEGWAEQLHLADLVDQERIYLVRRPVQLGPLTKAASRFRGCPIRGDQATLR